jgi:ATP-binding cassette, subfamily F, member 3
MLNVNNIYVQYGDRAVLDRISFAIHEQDRMGLVGVNGAGKSTLLKIIAGYEQPHEGNITYATGIRIGFLHQDMNIPKGKTVIEETMTAFDEIQIIEQRIAELEANLNGREDYESDEYMRLIEEYSELNERFQVLGGQNNRVDAEKILMGLGFKVAGFDKLTDTLSGGWQMRVELAKMLLKKPEYLLLDEPTNHLDIESIIWLENFLQNYEGCVIVISHDKTFLDNVTRRTVEIDLGKIYDYKANYSRYLQLRGERQELLQNAYENQQREIAQKERLIDRFRAKANKAKMAQSLIKELNRMERVEMDETNDSVMRLRFPPAPRSGEVAAEVTNMSKSYGDLTVLNKIDLQIVRGDRMAFVGKNGEGKSTLTKILVDSLSHDSGEVKLGHNVFVGYYAQNQADVLLPNITVLQTLEQVAPLETTARLRTILGSFLFTKDDVDKKVSVLSGGERARLAMACMLMKPINLLVLDEPTNHLDMRSKDVLKQALLAYDGTLIVVSHDRDFLGGLTDTTIEFDNKKLKTYLGDINYFLDKRDFANLRDVSLGKNANLNAVNKITSVVEEKKATKAVAPAPNAENIAKLKELRRTIQNAEKKINKLEEDIAKQELLLSDASIMNTPKYKEVLDKYRNLKAQLDTVMVEWENAELEREGLEVG